MTLLLPRRRARVYVKPFPLIWFQFLAVILWFGTANAEKGSFFSISYGQLSRLVSEESFVYDEYGIPSEWHVSNKQVRWNMFGVGLGFYQSRWTPQFELEFMISPSRSEGPDTYRRFKCISGCDGGQEYVNVRVTHELRNYAFLVRLRQRIVYRFLVSGGIGWMEESSEAKYHVPEGTVLLHESGLPLGRGGGEPIGIWSWGLDFELVDYLMVGFQNFEVIRGVGEEGAVRTWDGLITFHLTFVWPWD